MGVGTPDDILEAVARGEQASSAALALEARAATEPEVRAMIDASRPLGAAKLDAIADAVRITPAAPAAAKPSGGNVVAFLRRASIVVGPLALAAAIFLVLGRGGDKSSVPFVASGEKEMRGDSPPEKAGALRLRDDPDATFEIVARPATAAGGHVVAYVFAVKDGEPNAVEASVELAPEAKARLTQAVDRAAARGIASRTTGMDSFLPRTTT